MWRQRCKYLSPDSSLGRHTPRGPRPLRAACAYTLRLAGSCAPCPWRHGGDTGVHFSFRFLSRAGPRGELLSCGLGDERESRTLVCLRTYKSCCVNTLQKSKRYFWFYFMSLREFTGKSMKSCTYEIGKVVDRKSDQQGVNINVRDIILSCDVHACDIPLLL